jgi:hypothetical protein
MSKRNMLLAGLVLCGMLMLGFVAGKASYGTPAPPYTLTVVPSLDPSYPRFLLTDSRSPIIRLVTVQDTHRDMMTGRSVVDGRLALTVMAEFDLDKLSGNGRESGDAPAKP